MNNNNNNIFCPSCGHEFSIEHVLKSKIQDEHEKENQKKTEEFEKKEEEFFKKEKELKEREKLLEIQANNKMLEKINELEGKHAMEKLELKKKLDDFQKATDEMQKKGNQGSMQLQGEVQELALENLLKQEYRLDDISEVPKGVAGADCIQTVKNENNVECGIIVYESKNTKNWGNDWIEKLKKDTTKHKGDIAVLVTETMPKGKHKFYEEDGVYICRFGEVKVLSMVLREMLIRVESVKELQKNKGGKMDLLYEYLSSPDFSNRVKLIIDNYTMMQSGLEKEKKSMTKLWSEREKQIWGGSKSLIEIFGAINGISNNLIGQDDFLSLEAATENE